MKARLGIALLCSALVVANVGLWINVATRDRLTFNQRKETYLRHYPAPFNDALVLTMLNVLLSAAAFYLLTSKKAGREPVHAAVRVPLIGINAVLMGWNLFTLL